MKRIVDGVTFNTDTSTPVARWEYEDEKGYDTQATLHQTRLGAFFIVHEWTVSGKAKVWFEFTTREEVQKMMLTQNNVSIINDDILQEPPEAAEESAPGATLYIRVPSSLKSTLDGLAKDSGVSLNTWTMRCVERCAKLDIVGDRLAEIVNTGLAWASRPEGSDVDPSSDMIDHMHDLAVDTLEILGWRGKDQENLIVSAGIDGCNGISPHRHWDFFSEAAQ